MVALGQNPTTGDPQPLIPPHPGHAVLGSYTRGGTVVTTGCTEWPKGLHGGDKAKFTKQGQRLYKAGDWNRVRVECRGDQIRTWLNGGLRADFKDALTPKGFIGLQVHGIGGKKELVGATIRWRNLRIKELP